MNGRLLIRLCAFGLFLGVLPRADGRDLADADSPPPVERSTLRFLSAAHLEGELALLGSNRPGHGLQTERRVGIRILSYGPWFLDTTFEEELLWGLDLQQVDHSFDYFRAGRAFGPLDACFFWNHTCNNNVFGRGINDLHWNDLGIELSTDASPGAAWKRPWHLSARWGWGFLRNNNKYRWLGSAAGSWRGPVHEGGVPFARLTLDVVVDPDRITVCPVAEAGVSIRLTRALFLEPFVRLERRRDAMGYLEPTDTWFLVGMKLVQHAELGEGPEPAREPGPGTRFRLRAGYAARLFQEEIGYASSVGFVFTAPELLDPAVLSFETHTSVTTPPEDMFPNFYTMTAGPSVSGPVGGLTWTASYRYRERRAVGVHWEGEEFRLLHGLSLAAEPLAPLPATDRAQVAPERFRWRAGAGWFPAARAFAFRAEFGGSVCVHLGALGETLWFIEAQTRHFVGRGRPLTGYGGEISMRLPGLAGDARLFLRFERGLDPFRLGERGHPFLGFELLF